MSISSSDFLPMPFPFSEEGHFVSGVELWDWRRGATIAAKAAGVPIGEVDWLLQAVTTLDRLSLRLDSFKEQPQVELRLSLADLTRLWEQRLQLRVPLQYLLGTSAWREFSLRVSPAVLIPRPETELLIDLAVSATQGLAHCELPRGHWADLGTGSGAIALGLAASFPHAEGIYAVDVSGAALAVAQQNAQDLGLSHKIQFYQGSWLQPLSHLKGRLSGLVANPPYIPTAMLPELQPEVAWHEPHLALDGGQDGLECIRSLVSAGVDYLQPGGVWLVEMMAGQAGAVVELLEQSSYCQIQVHPDLAGIDRFALGYRSELRQS